MAGGYLEGVGETIAPGSSMTPKQRDEYIAAYRAAGVPDDWASDFLGRNPNDYHRVLSEWMSGQHGEGSAQEQAAFPSGSPNAGGGGAPAPDGGAAATQAQLDQILAAIQGMNAQPDVDLSGIDPGEFPVFEVPGEDLSPYIDNTLIDQMEGFDPLDVQGQLQALLAESQGASSARLQNRLEAAREVLTRGQEGALADLRGVLADRGLISLPGSPEGAELEMTTRAFEPLQRAFLAETREAEFEESIRSEERQMNLLTRAMGWTRDEAAQRLAAADAAGGRQQMLSSIALNVLDKNMEWNQFLAEFGLKREQVANEIRNGRIQNVMPVIQMFLALIQQSRGGHI